MVNVITLVKSRSSGISRAEVVQGLLLGHVLPRFYPFLRHHVPVLVTPKFALVTRDRDVRQVLGRRDDFSVAHYARKVRETTGPFVLGVDDDTHYGPADATIHAAIRADDPSRLAVLASGIAERAAASTVADGRVDVVSGFLEPVVARLATEYLGLGDTDERQLFDWSRVVFTEIFVSPTPAIRPPAMRVVEEFRSHLDKLIAARRSSGPPSPTGENDDVLGRLLAASVPDEIVSGTLLGLIVAWIPGASRMLAVVIDELLNRPEVLAMAQEAARDGDDRRLGAILFETARLRPAGPGIFRVAAQPSRLGLDSRRPRTIKPGLPVLAATASAMRDEEAVESPDEFRLDRPWSTYLFFGYGLHTCAGEMINRATVPAMLRPLMAHGALARAPGAEGQLSYRFPYPAHLVVTL